MTKLSLVLNSCLSDLSIEVSNFNPQNPYSLEIIQEKIEFLKMLSSKVEGRISDEELDEMWDKVIK